MIGTLLAPMIKKRQSGEDGACMTIFIHETVNSKICRKIIPNLDVMED